MYELRVVCALHDWARGRVLVEKACWSERRNRMRLSGDIFFAAKDLGNVWSTHKNMMPTTRAHPPGIDLKEQSRWFANKSPVDEIDRF